MSSKMEASDGKPALFEQLLVYVIQAISGLALFSLFFVTSIIADKLCKIFPEIIIMMMLKIVSWIISTLGAICCIALVFRNTIDFLKFLFKGPSQRTSGEKAADEGRFK